MHLFGYSGTSHELYLPLMYGSVSDVLMTPKKVKPNAKSLKEASVRIQVVHAVLEALLNGIINLHENGVAHRDIKLENLLLDFDPRDQRFGVSSVKISDLGFSLDISDANPINPEARTSCRARRRTRRPRCSRRGSTARTWCRRPSSTRSRSRRRTRSRA